LLATARSEEWASWYARCHRSMANSNDPQEHSPRFGSRRVVWAGGNQARDLAEVLTGGTATRAGANIVASCVDARANLLVVSNRTSLDLCSTAVPHDFDRTSTQSIVAAVGGGPHSLLAAILANWLSEATGIPASATFGYSDSTELAQARDVLEQISAQLPTLDARIVQASSPASMVEALPPGTLLVVGASGGSWFQRRFFGPGARIQARASAGTIVVQHHPRRVFQVMQPPIAFGPRMLVADALVLSEGAGIVVAERGKLLGTVTIAALTQARPNLTIRDVMEYGVFFDLTDTIADAIDLATAEPDSLIPVVDSESYLVGRVSLQDLMSEPSL